ncbi:MAG: hypothetical protein AAF206_27830 [Bacteroidota bacterium]
MKKHFLLIGILLISSLAVAQGTIRQRLNERRNERINAFKVGYFTRKLNLTPAEAKRFWPLYDQYSEELEEVRQRSKQLQRNVRTTINSMTDNEVEDLVDEFMGLKAEEFRLNQQYHTDFKKVLPIRKVVLFYKAQADFNRELLQYIRENRSKRNTYRNQEED